MEEPREPLLSSPNSPPTDSALNFVMEALGDSIQTDAANALQAHEKREQRLMYARMSGKDRRLNIYKSIATRDSSLALPVIFNPGERVIPIGRLQEFLSDHSRTDLPETVDIPQAIDILGRELAVLENGDIYRNLDTKQITEESAEALQNTERRIVGIKGGLLLLADRSFANKPDPDLGLGVSAFRAANVHAASELVPNWIVDSIAANIEPLDVNDEGVRLQLVQLLETPLFQATEEDRVLLSKGDKLTSRLRVIKKAGEAQMLAQQLAETKKREELSEARREAYKQGEQNYVTSAMARGTEAINTFYKKGESLSMRNFPTAVIIDNLPSASKSQLMEELSLKKIRLNSPQGLLFIFEFIQSDPELFQEVIDAASKQWLTDFSGVKRQEYLTERRENEWIDHTRKAVMLDILGTAESILERTCGNMELKQDDRELLQRSALKVLGGEHIRAFIVPDPKHPLTLEQQVVRTRLMEFQLIFDDAKFVQFREAVKANPNVSNEVREMLNRVTEVRETVGELDSHHRETVLSNFRGLVIVSQSSSEEYAADSRARNNRKQELREEKIRTQEAAQRQVEMEAERFKREFDELVQQAQGIITAASEINDGRLESAIALYRTAPDWQQQMIQINFRDYFQVNGKGTEKPSIEIKREVHEKVNRAEEAAKAKLDALKKRSNVSSEDLRRAELGVEQAIRNIKWVNLLEKKLEWISDNVMREQVSRPLRGSRLEGRFRRAIFNTYPNAVLSQDDIIKALDNLQSRHGLRGSFTSLKDSIQRLTASLAEEGMLNDVNARQRIFSELRSLVRDNQNLPDKLSERAKTINSDDIINVVVETVVKNVVGPQMEAEGLVSQTY